MKIAFMVHRTNYFKLYGPLIDEALTQGHQVQVWLYIAPQGGKDYLRPKPDELPEFRGEVEVREFLNIPDVYEQVVESQAEIIFSLHPKSYYTNGRSHEVVFATLQHGIDSFLETDPVGLASSDLLFLYSPFWLGWAGDYYEQELGLPATDTKAKISSVVRFAGFPQMDVLDNLDKSALRQKYGVPGNKKVVLLLPITLANKDGAWPRFFEAPNRMAQFVQLIRGAQKEGWEFAEKLWKWALLGWNDRALTEAIARFAQANDAFLIVKGREKDPIRPWMTKAADLVLYDEAQHPATVLELLAITDLCIQFYSFAALEAVYCNVPSLTVDRPSPSAGFLEPAPVYHALWRRSEIGSAFNYPGAVKWATIPEVITTLPRMNLKDFSVESAARGAYLDTYLAPVSQRASAEVLQITTGLFNESN